MSMGDGDARNSSLNVSPDVPAWRGRFTIRNRNVDINLKATKSSKACPVVLDIASLMPDCLCLEMLPLVDVWPEYLKCVQPTEFTIDLFFVSEERDNDVLDSLVANVMSTDSGLKAVICGKVELLIFTSLQLPEKLQRLDGKLYFWGLFMGPSDYSSHKSHCDVEIQNKEANLASDSYPSNSRTCEVEKSQENVLDEQRAYRSDRAGKRGRQLDDAWAHAKPLSEPRYKSQCNYCGYISVYGGISRLKAHLAGVNPSLPPCDKVSPEVKKAMVGWYNKWVTNTKAPWVIGYQATPIDNLRRKTPGRGRPSDAAWAHCERLDQNKFKTRCNHCGFISELGGISRLKVHLSGESPRVPACQKVSLEVKKEMSDWFHMWAVTAKPDWMMSSRGNSDPVLPSKRPREEGDAWEHVIRMDASGQHIKCKHCNFVPKHGGIDRMIVHLAGGDPEMQLKGCPNVSPELKSLILSLVTPAKRQSPQTCVREDKQSRLN